MNAIDANNTSANAYSAAQTTANTLPAATTSNIAPANVGFAQGFPALQTAAQSNQMMADPFGANGAGMAKMFETILNMLNSLISMLSMFMQRQYMPQAQAGAGSPNNASAGANAGATGSNGSAGASANAGAGTTNSGAAAGANANASANGTNASAGAAAGSTTTGSQASAGASAGATTNTGAPANTSNTNATTPAANVLPASTLEVIQNDAGQISVSTFDGYIIRTEGKDMAWTITGPDGKTTRIWGDPHVYESDGDKWDFLTQSSFTFGKNKVTVEVAPYGNGQTVTAKITIYSGEERVTIGGIDTNQPRILASADDALQHDMGLADGITFNRGTDAKGETWTSNQTNKVAGA